MKSRSGYILLITLLMIVMAGLFSMSLARTSLFLAMDAAKAQEDLQRRWGAISCRYVILHRAEILFRKRECIQNDNALLLPRIQTTIRLGSMDFDLLLSDEQAKLNLNTVLVEKRLRSVERVLNIAPNSPSGLLSVELSPHPDAVPDELFPPAFDSWGQLFSYERSRHSQDGSIVARAIRDGTTDMTCWGDGKLNVLRAEIPLLRMTCRLLIPNESANRFLKSRTKCPHWNLEQLLNRTDLQRKERRVLRKWLTDRSTCHSLWIIASDGKREWVILDVLQSLGQNSHPRIVTFNW